MWRKVLALRVLLPKRVAWRKCAGLAAVAGLLVAAFCCGRWGALSEATAQTGQAAGQQTSPFPEDKADEPGRPVAYIYNSVPVTRQDLGEYLIARFGAERVDFLVNRKIIEQVCKSKGVYVTDAEVEAQLVDDLRKMNVPSLDLFVKNVLKRFNKSLYEYKEDVIRPKLALAKLCRQNIVVTEQDLRDEFEAKYGEKVEVRMLVLSKEQARLADQVWSEIKTNPEAWDKHVRNCFIPQLASSGGQVPPVHKHFGDKRIEEQAFRLKDGEISTLIPVQDGTTVILKRVKAIPPDTTHDLAQERNDLYNEVFERKLNTEIPKMFQEMKAQASPRVFLEADRTDPSFAHRVNTALQAALKGKSAPIPTSMTGN